MLKYKLTFNLIKCINNLTAVVSNSCQQKSETQSYQIKGAKTENFTEMQNGNKKFK